MGRPDDRRCIACDTALLDLLRPSSVCIAVVLVRIERDMFTPPWCGRFSLVPRRLLATGLPGYRLGDGSLEGRPDRSGPFRPGSLPRRLSQAVTLMCRPESSSPSRVVS